MRSPATFPARGFLVEVDSMPAEIGQLLQREGVARAVLETVAGLYVEPAGSVDAVLRAFASAGAPVRALRPAGAFQAPATVRPGQRPFSRLRNPRCAEWFPLLAA
ncbi:MAG: hypothetical protein IT304_01035 [Dehalococcoidia bacterium]|nr:hypothetical protein [Dehalococcoidia bacterium]